MTCPIRCETYTPANPAVVCPDCKSKACKKCTKQYLLNTSLDPHCMHCRVGWSTEFIEATFSESFVKNEFRKHTIMLLAEREKAYFPQTILEIEIEKAHKDVDRARSFIQNLQHVLFKEYSSPSRYYYIYNINDIPIPLLPTTIGIPEEKVNEYNSHVMDLNTKLNTILELRVRAGDGQAQPELSALKTTRPCPAAKCEGFLTSRGKCAACGIHVCDACEAIMRQDTDGHILPHTCDPNEVATVETKRKESKPCPKCGTYVSKVSGCNQMWCISCKIFFDWQTLHIIQKGIFHNPHYFEWLAKNRDNPTEQPNANDAGPAGPAVVAPCVQGWPWQNPRMLLTNLSNPRMLLPFEPQFLNTLVSIFYDMCRLMNEIWDNDQTNHGYAYRPEDTHELRKLRVSGKITDKVWHTKLSSKETRRKTKEKQHQILMSLMMSSRDVVGRMHADEISLEAAIEQLLELKLIANNALHKGHISEHWVFYDL
jgi:hypothetical protein